MREAGLAGLSMRDLAQRAGITTPTVYSYFESKNDIYDAMFGEAVAEFAARMEAPYEVDDPTEVLRAGALRFMAFCAEDVARYQLLFQRTIPGFEPSPGSFAHAVAALQTAEQRLASVGVSDPRHLDLWTALTTGLVDQQISNDPGGERWSRLVDDAVTMFLAHCRAHPNQPPTDEPRAGAPARRGA